MVDFRKLAEKIRLRVHKVHVTYRCDRCGTVTTYVQVMPEHLLYCWGNNWRKRTCGGRQVEQKRRVVLRVLCCPVEQESTQSG
jgi:hypothetical protein